MLDGGKIVSTNSNRFATSPSDKSTLSVISAAKISAGNIGSGAEALLGTVATGAFPRELSVTADGKTLFVTNFLSQSLEMIDLPRLPLTAR